MSEKKSLFTKEEVIEAWESGWKNEFEKISSSKETFEKKFFESAQIFIKRVKDTIFGKKLKKEFLLNAHKSFRNAIARALEITTI
jgi:hypothetical protein